MKRIKHFVSLFLLLGIAYLSFYSLIPREASGPKTLSTEFSTARALEQLKVISKDPHYVGSPAHKEVRDYIITELEQLGLKPEIQEGFTLDTWRGYSDLVKPQNILAKIKGSNNTKALLLMSHYDSAPHSKSRGASDAGSGVVTVLESLRAYIASGEQPQNDIIILFTDSEELGLNGASLFVNEHPWAKDVGVALNFEARGSSGPSNMIVETNGGNKNLIKEFAAAELKYPVATSLMYSIYKMLPNDTDSTVLRENGDIDGFFFAFIDDHWNYHTQNDTWQNLNLKTLEHQGRYLLPLIKHFAKVDLINIKSEDDYVYFDVALFNFVSYPFSWIWPMVAIAMLLFFYLLIKGIRDKRIRMSGIGRGFAALIVSLVGSLFLLQLLGWLWPVIYPQYADMLPVFIYNGHWYTAAFVTMSFAFSFGIYSHLTKPERTASVLIAPLFMWLIINSLLALKLQGGAFFIIPVFFILLALYVMLHKKRPSVLLMTLLCAPAVLIFAPLIQFLPVGLGPGDGYAPSVVISVLLFGLLIPVFGFYRNKRFLGYIGLALTFVFLMVANAKSDYTEERQKPNSLVYYTDSDSDKAYYVTYDKIPDPWVTRYVGENPERASKFVKNAGGSKYNTPFTFAKETPKIDLAKSSITLERDKIIEGSRERTFSISPNRPINRIRLYADQDVRFTKLIFNGKEVPVDTTDSGVNARESKNLLSYYLSQGDDLKITYATVKDQDPKFRMQEYSLDLLENPSFIVNKRPKYTMPKPFVTTDAIVVETGIEMYNLAFAKAKTDSIVE